jgi:hypothetical protein
LWPIEHWQIQLAEYSDERSWAGSHEFITGPDANDQFFSDRQSDVLRRFAWLWVRESIEGGKKKLGRDGRRISSAPRPVKISSVAR